MFVAVFLFLSILTLLFYLDSKKPRNFPPGPPWLPVLGSVLTVAKLKKSLEGMAFVTAELVKEYGPIVGIKLGQEKTIIVYGKAEIKEFLMNEDLNGRPLGPFYDLRTQGQRRGILCTDEDFWVEQRRFVLRQLREFGFGKRSMSDYIENEAEVMVNHIKKQMGGKTEVTMQMDSMFGIYIINTLWTMMAGTKYKPDDENLVFLQESLNNLFVSAGMAGALFSHFPVLRYVLPEYSGYNLYMNAHRPIWEFVTKEINKHRETYDPEVKRDFIDMYLEMMDNPNKPESFSDQQLMCICLDLFIAGSETTVKTIGFAMQYLLLNPRVQKKAREEIDRVVGKDRIPSLADRPNMPYMEAIVLESTRHFMGRTLGVPHRALKDVRLGKYVIPKNTMIVPCFHGIFFGDESQLDDPMGFVPERFLDGDGKISIQEHFIPFGIGKRRCLGETLARGNLFVFVAALIQHFDMTYPPNEKPTTISQDGITAGPRPYKGVIRIREDWAQRLGA